MVNMLLLKVFLCLSAPSPYLMLSPVPCCLSPPQETHNVPLHPDLGGKRRPEPTFPHLPGVEGGLQARWGGRTGEGV